MLGNDRVRKGLETLQTVKSLETLDLQDNEIDRTCLPAIQEFLCASNLKQLYLQGNPLHPRDFDELEPIVSKLGRECIVYCYKNKDQPMRKLICSIVKQVGGFDESLSFSNAQLSSIFQKYKDRAAFFQNAVDEEIVYSHKSKLVTAGCEVPLSVAGDEATAITPAQPSSTDSSVRVDTDVLNDAAGVVSVDDASGADLIDVDAHHLDHDMQSNLPSPILSHTRLEPVISSAPSTTPAAPAPSHIDSIVAMGFELEAARVAYTKSGRDVQVCRVFTAHISTFLTENLQRAVQILINKTADSSSDTLAAFPKKKQPIGDAETGLKVGSNRRLEAIPVAPVLRQRRIQDDDDDDDIPVSRGAIAALLPVPQSKLPQVSATNDDDEIVLLRMTQSTQQAAINYSAAVSLTALLDTSINDNSSNSKSLQSNDFKSHGPSEDDDVPMVHPPESNHAIQESMLSPTIPAAAAAPASVASTTVARPKLKGLGSLARR